MKKGLLTLMMMLLPMFVCAYDIEVNGIYYNIVSKTKTATVTYKDEFYNTYSGDIIIPSQIDYKGDSYSVTTIGWSAFRACDNLKSIVIPNSVTSMEKSAFYQSKGLLSINIPESVTSIGDCAFEGCSSLEKITLPDGIEKLNYCLFQFCSNLHSVNIPESVLIIDAQAFRGCKSLSKIDIPHGVHTIGGYAFAGCSSLIELSIPQNVTMMGISAFEGCVNLESVNIPLSITTISDKIFSECEKLKEIDLHENIVSIGNSSFMGCKSLLSLKMPKELKSIGNNAFYGCDNLKEILFFDNINTIGSCAFFGCKKLVSIDLPDGISSIEYDTFNGCSSLSTIIIPNTVESIGSLAFANCSELIDFTCYSSIVPQTDNNIFTNSLIEYATLHVPSSSIKEYQAVDPWKGFKEIVAIDMPKYTLTYIVDGKVYKSYQIEGGAPITPEPAPNKEGYTFSGWSEIPETMPAHDVTVTGTFSINKYILTYTIDGEEYKVYEIEYGATITPEPAPDKEGYTFSGWSEIPETMPAHDVMIIGTFTRGSYKLTYMVDGKAYKTVSYDYGDVITPEPEPEKEGCTFGGWSEIPETMPAEDVTVTGTFSINTYILTYTVDGEEFSSSELEYGASITPVEEPTKEGYTFSGWSEIPETMPAHDVTVTGSFSVNSYKLTYMVDNEVYKEIVYEYGATIVPEPQPDGNYATFEWEDLPETMPAHDVVIHASYTTGIIDVIRNSQSSARIYTPDGKKRDQIQKGMNIVVLNDGTIHKIVIR